MASTTTTETIALELINNAARDSDSARDLAGPGASNFDPAADAVVAESRIADAEVPDGGYGWVVIAACSVLCFWFVGTPYSWGVIQAALVKDRVSTPASLSFVGSLTAACISFLALANARLIRKIGGRNTALAGAAFLGTGGILSSFTTRNVGGLFFTTGVLMGTGCSLQFMVCCILEDFPRQCSLIRVEKVASTMPAQYFNKRRGLANGIVYAGGGVGGTVISFAMDGLIQKLGPEWTFRIIGLVTLATSLPAAWLIKERAPIKTTTLIEWYVFQSDYWQWLTRHRRLFKNMQFTVLFLAGAIATFPLFVPPFFLPLYAASLGLSASAGAGIVAGFNFSSAVGRLCCGLLSDFMGPVNTLLLSLILSALSMLVLWPVSNSLGPLIVFVIINGVANGGFFSTMPTVVGSVFGSRRVGVAMGMIVSGWAGGYLMVRTLRILLAGPQILDTD